MNIAVWYKIAMTAARVAKFAERRYLDKIREDKNVLATGRELPKVAKRQDLGSVANFEELKRRHEERTNVDELASPETVRQDD